MTRVDDMKVSDGVYLLYESFDPIAGVVSIRYKVADVWIVTLKMPVGGDAPRSFTDLHFQRAREATGDVDITNRLLRLIPFRGAQQRAIAKVRMHSIGDVPSPPKAYSGTDAYARLAESFLAFDQLFPDQPLKQMAEHFKLNRNTLAARVNRAKDMGLLIRPSKQEPYELSEGAKRLLRDDAI